MAIHDTTYLLDFSVKTIKLDDSVEIGDDPIAEYVLKELELYERTNLSKFIGAGLPHELLRRAPKLCSRLWLELDIIPISITPELEGQEAELKDQSFWSAKCVDEQADSMARKCITYVRLSTEPFNFLLICV